MKLLVLVYALQVCRQVTSEIRSSIIVNKLVKVKPVGENVGKKFMPLTELPPPHPTHYHSGRRHYVDCHERPEPREVDEGAKVDIIGDYYDDKNVKTVATVIIPDHIDHKHFQVTTEVPYLTVGPIEALGYHPSTLKSEHPSECEKIYQDHLDEQYSEESKDYSEESLEMIRMPLFGGRLKEPAEEEIIRLYSDMEN